MHTDIPIFDEEVSVAVGRARTNFYNPAKNALKDAVCANLAKKQDSGSEKTKKRGHLSEEAISILWNWYVHVACLYVCIYHWMCASVLVCVCVYVYVFILCMYAYLYVCIYHSVNIYTHRHLSEEAVELVCACLYVCILP